MKIEIDPAKFVFVEKELCSPINGNTVGPYFHVYTVDENGKKNELFVEKSGDIKAAVREAERQMDISLLAASYAENPDSFKSSVNVSSDISAGPIMFNGIEFTEDEVAEITNVVNKIVENAKKRQEKKH